MTSIGAYDILWIDDFFLVFKEESNWQKELNEREKEKLI